MQSKSKDTTTHNRQLKSLANTRFCTMMSMNMTSNSTLNVSSLAYRADRFSRKNFTLPMIKENVELEIVTYTLYGLIFMSGFLGNLLVVVKIVRSDKTKSLKHCFLLNLAITDLLTLFVVLPLTVTGRHLAWPFGEFICKYIFPLTDVVIAVSVLTHVSISLDRYRTIIYPMSSKPSHMQRLFTLATIWVLSYLLNGLPLSLVLRVGDGYWVEKACVLHWPNIHIRNAYYLQRIIMIFILPIIVNLLSYVRISKALKASLLLLQGSARGKKRETRIRSQQRLIRMFRAIFIAFVVCFFPIHLLTMLDLYLERFAAWSGSGQLFQVALVFAYANSTCNPVILVIMSTDYRKTFYSYLPKIRCPTFSTAAKDSEQLSFKYREPGYTMQSLNPRSKDNFDDAHKYECYDLTGESPLQNNRYLDGNEHEQVV